MFPEYEYSLCTPLYWLYETSMSLLMDISHLSKFQIADYHECSTRTLTIVKCSQRTLAHKICKMKPGHTIFIQIPQMDFWPRQRIGAPHIFLLIVEILLQNSHVRYLRREHEESLM